MIPKNNKRPVVFVVPGDLHLTEPCLDNYRAACWMIDEVNELIQPDFVQFVGDNVQHGTPKQYQLFHDVASRLVAPHFALVGDHDLDGMKSLELFIEHVGDPFGSIELRGFRFIRLNSQEARPVGFSEDQLDWLESEFDNAAQQWQRVVVFQHNYPYQIWEDFSGKGVDRWRRLMLTRPVIATICGHTHYFQTANDGRNVSIAVRSIGDPEGGSAGYLLGFVHDDDLAIKYRTVDDRGPVALITHPREALLATSARHIIHGPDEIRVRVWSLKPIHEARWRIDGGDWHPLQNRSEGEWSAPLSGQELTKGEHLLEILAGGPGVEETANDSLTFIVDQTRRFTSIPMVRPIVKQTNFC